MVTEQTNNNEQVPMKSFAHQKKMSESTHHVVIDEHGPPCPRCHRPMQVHEHDVISEKQLRGPFYYSRWNYCMNPDCLTNVVHDSRFKVINDPPWWSVEPVKSGHVRIVCDCGHSGEVRMLDMAKRLRCTKCGEVIAAMPEAAEGFTSAR
jgi:hypothetical protein